MTRIVLVVTRFSIGGAEADSFTERARVALAPLAARPGYRGGRLARAVDEPSSWLITTEWDREMFAPGRETG
jgi:heme-degrading monooxygenase HmoA